jgi:hypothetical protein
LFPQAERATTMGWRERIRSERGSIATHATRSTREMDLPFEGEKYPALAKAARDWSETRISRFEKLRRKMRRRRRLLRSRGRRVTPLYVA